LDNIGTFEQKKVQEVKGSFYIYLPKSWAKKYDLETKKVVYINNLDDDSLLIRPDLGNSSTDSEKIIEWGPGPSDKTPISTDDFHDFLLNQYLTAYIIGYHRIIFDKKSASMSLKSRAKIRNFTQKLHGMMVVSESANQIIVEDTTITVNIQMLMRQILNKVGLLINTFNQIVKEDSEENIEDLIQQDDQVDEHRYAIERTVHKILRHPKLALEAKTNAIECLHYGQCAKIIERVGDYITKLAVLYKSEPIKNKEFVLDHLYKMYNTFTKMQDNFERTNSLQFYLLIKSIKQYAEETKEMINEGHPDKNYISPIRRINNLIADIAEIRINDILSRQFS
jgi:phosphate uptake regulator